MFYEKLVMLIRARGCRGPPMRVCAVTQGWLQTLDDRRGMGFDTPPELTPPLTSYEEVIALVTSNISKLR